MKQFVDTGRDRKKDSPRPSRRMEQPQNAAFSRRFKDNHGISRRPGRELPKKTDYSRPSGWPAGMREKVWNNAKGRDGKVRDPLTGKVMSRNKPWDMGHKPGYEFAKHQKSAESRGIDRQTFRNEYYNAEHYRPELPSSNRSHKGEDKTANYFGA